MKSDETLQRLEAAKKRILDGQPERIAQGGKLSVSACEKEAGLGNGSAYYYPDFTLKIKNEKSAIKAPTAKAPTSEAQRLKEEVKEERRIKIKYRNKLIKIREEKKQMARTHTQMMDILISSRAKIKKLESELKRKNITRIK